MAKKKKQTAMIPAERIERSILLIRGHKVMLDGDLASLYGVETKVLNQAVKRNLDRFPDDFMFQLTWEETEVLRSQIVTLDIERGGPSRSQPVTLKRGQNPKYRERQYDRQFKVVFDAIRQLMAPAEPKKRRKIGFHVKESK